MAEPALRVEQLSLSFGGLRVLARVSFEVHPGELLALIGPNGAGKTSILNCIGGIYRPTTGRRRRCGPWSAGRCRRCSSGRWSCRRRWDR